MTRDEAHDWLEAHSPDAGDFCIEWLGDGWQAYQWIGPAGEDYETRKDMSFIACVEWIKDFVEKRSASNETART